MISVPVDCVVDASVGIKLVVVEMDSAQASLLFNHLTRDPTATFRVPDLFFAECANVLRTRARRGDFSTRDAMAKLRSLRALALQIEASSNLIEDALDLALTHDLTVYDAIYAALSIQNGSPLITADDKLFRKLACSPCSALLLSGQTIPSPP